MPKGQYFSNEVKERALELYDRGYSQRDVAKKMKTAKSTLGRWIRERMKTMGEEKENKKGNEANADPKPTPSFNPSREVKQAFTDFLRTRQPKICEYCRQPIPATPKEIADEVVWAGLEALTNNGEKKK